MRIRPALNPLAEWTDKDVWNYIAEHDPMLADVLRLADAMGLIRPAA